MLQYLYRALIELTNGRWTSFLLRKFVQSHLSQFFIPFFVRVYNINLEEAELPINEYKTLHHVFIRKLKPGVRSVHNHRNSVVSPVDGMIEASGKITSDLKLQVKGKSYSVLEMLGTKEKVNKYLSGSFLIIYLSPSNYHRIHSPFSGRVTGQWTLGCKSYPVNRWGLKYGKEPLSKNYRKITELNYGCGHIAIVKVGAMFINSIETTYKGENLVKGEELGYFNFGSTILLLFEKNTFESVKTVKTGLIIKMGEEIGYLKKNEQLI